MKMVKNIAALLVAASFMFGGVSFHMSNVYADMDGTTSVENGFGATWALNENTSLGYDSQLGMIFSFEVPAGVSLRLGTDASAIDSNGDGTDDVAGTSLGLGYTWWTGGAGLKTSISTAYDQIMDNTGADPTSESLTMTVGFGF